MNKLELLSKKNETLREHISSRTLKTLEQYLKSCKKTNDLSYLLINAYVSVISIKSGEK